MVAKELQVGLRVILNEKAHHELVGKAGEIVYVDGDVAGIKLDEMLYLHDCNGLCEPGYGWYEKAEAFDEESSSPYCRLIPKDKELFKSLRSKENFTFNNVSYQVKKNGALFIIEYNGQKIIAVNTIMNVLMFLKCTTVDEAVVANHLLDLYKISEMHTVKFTGERFELVAYTQKDADELVEASAKAEQVTPPVAPKTEGTAVEYQSEEEILKALGITK